MQVPLPHVQGIRKMYCRYGAEEGREFKGEIKIIKVKRNGGIIRSIQLSLNWE